MQNPTAIRPVPKRKHGHERDHFARDTWAQEQEPEESRQSHPARHLTVVEEDDPDKRCPKTDERCSHHGYNPFFVRPFTYF
jgi:hypothetical protein